tara:strand:- start:1318 stop:1824 length:507 start_codon:yes stop_codon:yes gene_type:complete
MAIHVHRAMHGSMTRNPKHGISMLTLAKFVRLMGGDSLHIGTVIGKLVGKRDEVLLLEREVEHDVGDNFKKGSHVLSQNWHKIKPAFAVSSGGLHPGLIPQIMHMLGNDIMVQLGGGIHGHPQGSKSGAIALRHSIDAVMNNISLVEYSRKSSELSMALEKWGHIRPK